MKTTPEQHMARVIAQGDMRPIEDNQDAMETLIAIINERSTPFIEPRHAWRTNKKPSIMLGFEDLMLGVANQRVVITPTRLLISNYFFLISVVYSHAPTQIP